MYLTGQFSLTDVEKLRTKTTTCKHNLNLFTEINDIGRCFGKNTEKQRENKKLWGYVQILTWHKSRMIRR